MYIHSLAVKRQRKGPMELVPEVILTETEGVQGDCRGGGGFLYGRQVTVISLEQWQEACLEIGATLPEHTRRANVCIGGHSFGPEDKGNKIYLYSGAVLEITGETKPCKRMDEIKPGLRKALEPNWRGGVTCRVLYGGPLATDQLCSIGQ